MSAEWLKEQIARNERVARLQKKLRMGSKHDGPGGDGLVHDLGGLDSQTYAMKTGDGWIEPIAGHVTVIQQADGSFGVVPGRESQILNVDVDDANKFLGPGQALDVRTAMKEDRRRIAEKKKKEREKKRSVG